MYNRRRKNNIIIGSLLAIVFVMAVGYAAFATNLNISGSSSISSNWDIEITGIRGANPSGGNAYDISAPTYTKTSATFNTGLKTPGVDDRVYEIEISNLGTLTGLVTIANLSCGNNSAIGCEVYESDMKGIDDEGNWGEGEYNRLDFADGTSDYSDIFFTIAPGEKHYLYIDVWYSYLVTSQPENLSANISLELTYEQAGLDSNGIAIPPITGTVYSMSKRTLNIGDSIMGVTTTLDPSTFNSTVYLKHDVVNDVIKAQYLCFVTDTEHCIQSGNYEANKALMQSQESWFVGAGGKCRIDNSGFYCRANTGSGYIRVSTESDFLYWVYATNDNIQCNIFEDDGVECTPPIG